MAGFEKLLCRFLFWLLPYKHDLVIPETEIVVGKVKKGWCTFIKEKSLTDIRQLKRSRTQHIH